MKDDFWKSFPPIPGFDCVEKKQGVQQRIYEETKNMTPLEIVAYFKEKSESRTALITSEAPKKYGASEN